jgi:hypothetical protein
MSDTGAYARQANAVANVFASESIARRSSPPEVVAKPLMALRRWLTDRQFDALISRAGGVPRN